jgi:hypothetical protein
MAQYPEGTVADGPNGPLVYRGGKWTSASPQGGPVALGSGNPKLPGEITGQALENTNKSLEAQLKQAQIDLAAAKNPLEVQQLKLQLQELQQKIAQGVGGNRLTAEVRAKAIASFEQAKSIEKIASELETEFQNGPGKTSGVRGLNDFLPTDANSAFDTTAGKLRGYVKQGMGFTGGENNTARESEMNIGPFIPSSWNRDSNITRKIASLRDVARQARETATAQLGGEPDANGNIVPVQALAHDKTRNVPDPKANALVTRLIRAGMPDAEINAALKDIGSDPVAPNSLRAIRAFQKQHPGASYSGATKAQQNSAWNRFAASPGGALAASYFDGATAGGVSALAGQEGRDGLQALGQEHPLASLIGGVAGGLSATLGAGKVMGATRFAPWLAANAGKAGLAGDLLYGGTYGFNTADEGNGLLGATEGAAGAFLGNKIGSGITKGVGNAVRGVSDPAVDFLRSKGIALTGGQMAGGLVKRLEDTLAGYGFAGAPLRNRLTEGLEGLNRAGYDIAGQPIAHTGTDVGRAGLDGLNAAKSNAYDTSLNGMNLTTDAAYQGDRALADASGAALPDTLRPTYDVTMRKADSFVQPGGQIPGRSAQAIKQTLRREIKANKNVPGGQFVGDALGQADDAFMGLAARQEPDMTALYRQADLTHGRSRVLGKAVDAASGKPGDPGIWTGSQLSNALKGPNVTNDARQALQPLADNAIRILPAQVPDSGTAGRLALGAVAAGSPMAALGYATGGSEGAETGGAGALGTVLSLAALNTKAGRSAMEKILLDRPELLRKIGNGIFGKAGLIGSASRGAGATFGGLLGN